MTENDKMKDLSDYEKSEQIAIEGGKRALDRIPWAKSRNYQKTKGFFAELLYNDIVHPGYCEVHCVDGVGTKLFLAPWSGNYRLGGTDGIAMNANDKATLIHPFPSALNLYIATQEGFRKEHMEETMHEIVDAIERIRIPNAPFDLAIGKFETASLEEIVCLGIKGKGFDIGIVMTGYIAIDKIPNLDPKPGHIIVGVSSTGMHSNGFTGGRHTLLAPDPALEYREEFLAAYHGKYSLNSKPEILEGKTVLEAMQVPTALYTVEAALIGQQFDNRDIYGVNITGNGLHNFNRTGNGVSFEITKPLPLLPIHKLLIQESGWSPTESYTKQNNGLGIAYIIPTLDIAEKTVDLINNRGEHKAQIIGEVVKSNESQLRTTLHKPYEGPAISFIGYTK